LLLWNSPGDYRPHAGPGNAKKGQGVTLRPYWRRNGADAIALMRTALSEGPAMVERARRYDEELMRDLEQAGGPKYAALAALAHRRAPGAQHGRRRVHQDARRPPELARKRQARKPAARR